MTKKVLVIGDTIIDEFTYGSRLGLSAETPTIVMKYERHERRYGGAALVARHLLRLGCEVTMMTFGLHFDLDEGPSRIYFAGDERYGTYTIKHRYFCEGYKLLQVDTLSSFQQDDDAAAGLLYGVLGKHRFDAVIVADNRHGVLTERFSAAIVEACRNADVKTYVDSQFSQSEPNHHWYRGCDTLFLNEKEFWHWVPYHSAYESGMHDLKRHLECNVLIVKLGGAGALCLRKDGVLRSVDGCFVEVVDTCGAGDAFLAAYVASGEDLSYANRWAALSVTKLGTQVPLLYELDAVHEPSIP